MKGLIAKVLGYLILFGSVLLKAPQIYNIFITRTGHKISIYYLHLFLSLRINVVVEGLSPIALYIEVRQIIAYISSTFILSIIGNGPLVAGHYEYDVYCL